MKIHSILDEPFHAEFPCIRVSQPIGDFFVASMDKATLCAITHADVRRMYQEREVETYLGIQRPLKKDRVEEIAQFVNTVDACFPTAVILAVDGRCAEFDDKRNVLILRNYVNPAEPDKKISSIEIAKVLDGQHRIEGLRHFSGESFDVNVSVFIDIDIESQAYIFSTVNLAQTKVNKSLVYDLFEYAQSRSPQKTCHNVAVALDQLKEGPLYHRIKRLGTATEGRFTETLTQATFVESLLPYLTDNKIQDRDAYLRGRKPPRAGEQESRKLIFRNMFLDEQDLQIADILLYYFDAVRLRWPRAWSSQGQGYMLNKTNGFRALMRLLRQAYLYFAAPGEMVTRDQFVSLFKKSTLRDDDFTIQQFEPGTSGEGRLYRTLVEQLRLEKVA